MTSAAYGLGAAALTAAAASGGLEIAGIFLAPAVLTDMAGVVGTMATLYSFVAQNIC